jgi:acyl-CoA dehydrogenase
MIWIVALFLLVTALALWGRWPLWAWALAILAIPFISYYNHLAGKLVSIASLLIFLVLTVALAIPAVRLRFFSKPFYQWLKRKNPHWRKFRRIDSGWMVSDFEKSLFRGTPQCPQSASSAENELRLDASILQEQTRQQLQTFLKTLRSSPEKSRSIKALQRSGLLTLCVPKSHQGAGLSPQQLTAVLQTLSSHDPLLASLAGMVNLESLISLLAQFGNSRSNEHWLAEMVAGKKSPFLTPTTLYELLESGRASLEARVDEEDINGETTLGVRLSFENVILLGHPEANCFYLAANVTDFGHQLGESSQAGTALCCFQRGMKGLELTEGLATADGLLRYYSCTARDVFVPLSDIIGGRKGIGRGIEFLFRNQALAASLWPPAISVPLSRVAITTAWHFAQLQKQNGRPLLKYRLVVRKLNQQISQCLQVQQFQQLALQANAPQQRLRYTAILFKNRVLEKTLGQLNLLRGILGSQAHYIKSEHKLSGFHHVVHLSMEMDGASHEINQLPLLKKAAMAAHPWYEKEVAALASNDDASAEFDRAVFAHLGYLLRNSLKNLALSTALVAGGRLLPARHRQWLMLRAMSTKFALVTDLTLIAWTIKEPVNTGFAGHVAEVMTGLVEACALLPRLLSTEASQQRHSLLYGTYKNALYHCQQHIKETINAAFGRKAAFWLKWFVFPTGRPLHSVRFDRFLAEDFDTLCGTGQTEIQGSPLLRQIIDASAKLAAAQSAENAVTNATGTALTTDNFQVLIDRSLAAGIISVDQAESLRDAYKSIQRIKLTNHFGKKP